MKKINIIKIFEYLPEKLLRRNVNDWYSYRFHIKYFGLIDEAKEKGIRSIVVNDWLGYENPEKVNGD